MCLKNIKSMIQMNTFSSKSLDIFKYWPYSELKINSNNIIIISSQMYQHNMLFIAAHALYRSLSKQSNLKYCLKIFSNITKKICLQVILLSPVLPNLMNISRWTKAYSIVNLTLHLGKNLKKLKMRKILILWYLCQKSSRYEFNTLNIVKFNSRLVWFS